MTHRNLRIPDSSLRTHVVAIYGLKSEDWYKRLFWKSQHGTACGLKPIKNQVFTETIENCFRCYHAC